MVLCYGSNYEVGNVIYKLSIVVPVLNQYNFTKSCLDDLFHLPPDHQIIIVDNGSTDQTRSLDQIRKDNFVYIRNETNLGFADGCGTGYNAATGNSIMFLNNDIRVQSNHSDWTVPILEACQDRCLAGPTIGNMSDTLEFISETDHVVTKNHYISGWNISANASVWKDLIMPGSLGPFTNEFGKAYHEDTDLSFRARDLGIGLKIVPVPVVHFGRVTSRSVGLSDLYLSSKAKFRAKWLR